MIGYVNMFNIDQARTIFLEVTNSEALRILSRQGHITWAWIVAPKIASITMKNSTPHGLAGLG